MTPKQLFESRQEYKLYPLKVFRKHIYQEEKRRKFMVYLESKKE